MRPHVALVPKTPLAAALRAGLSRFAWLVSTAALLAACSSGGAQGADASSDKLAIEAPRTAAATEIEVPVTLSLDGTLLADEESRVTSVVPGRVMAVLVERGQVVKKGDPLVRLRDVDYRLQAQAAEAALEQARARLGVGETNEVPRPEDTPDVRAAAVDKDLAEKNLVRSEELAKRGVLSTQQLDEARSRTTAAKERYSAALNSSRGAAAQLSSAKVALDQARVATSEAVVRAPFDGEIAERMVSVGEYIGPQTALVTLVRTDPLRLELQVPQQHVSRVKQGQHVTVSLDAFPNQTFEGAIRYVSASVSRTTRGLVVEAVVPNAARTLRPGMFANVRIETGSTERVPSVPSTAVLTEAGVSRVFVVVGKAIEERVVSVREKRSDELVLEGGVKGGELLATEKLDRLADGLVLKAKP